MAIRVVHGGSPGFAALTGYAAGVTDKQRKDRDAMMRAYDITQRRRLDKDQQAEASRQFDVRTGQQNQQFYDELGYRRDQADANRQTQFGLANLAQSNRLQSMSFENDLNRENAVSDQELTFDKMDYQNDLYKDRYEHQYTFEQQQQFDKNNKTIQELRNNPAKYGFRPDEADQAIEALERQNAGIISSPQSSLRQSRYPQGQREGESWQMGGMYVGRDQNGKIYKIGDSGGVTPKDRVSAYQAALKLLDNGDSDTPLDMQKVEELANKIMGGGDIQQQGSPDPSTPLAPDDNTPPNPVTTAKEGMQQAINTEVGGQDNKLRTAVDEFTVMRTQGDALKARVPAKYLETLEKLAQEVDSETDAIEKLKKYRKFQNYSQQYQRSIDTRKSRANQSVRMQESKRKANINSTPLKQGYEGPISGVEDAVKSEFDKISSRHPQYKNTMSICDKVAKIASDKKIYLPSADLGKLRKLAEAADKATSPQASEAKYKEFYNYLTSGPFQQIAKYW